MLVRLSVHHIAESGKSDRVRVSFRDKSEHNMSNFTNSEISFVS